MWKNVQPAYNDEIQTHDVQIASLIILPLDQDTYLLKLLFN